MGWSRFLAVMERPPSPDWLLVKREGRAFLEMPDWGASAWLVQGAGELPEPLREEISLFDLIQMADAEGVMLSIQPLLRVIVEEALGDEAGLPAPEIDLLIPEGDVLEIPLWQEPPARRAGLVSFLLLPRQDPGGSVGFSLLSGHLLSEHAVPALRALAGTYPVQGAARLSVRPSSQARPQISVADEALMAAFRLIGEAFRRSQAATERLARRGALDALKRMAASARGGWRRGGVAFSVKGPGGDPQIHAFFLEEARRAT
jgi:hypothetical protein